MPKVSIVEKIWQAVTRPLLLLPVVTLLLVLGWTAFSAYAQKQLVDIPSDNLLANGSFEELGENRLPIGWIAEQKGQMVAKASSSKGYIGERGLKISINDYVDGNLTLEGPKTPLDSNGKYFFKAYYITDGEFDLMFRIHYKDGSTKLVWYKHYYDYDYPWSTMASPIDVPDSAIAVSPVISLFGNVTIEVDGAFLRKMEGRYQKDAPDNLVADGGINNLEAQVRYPRVWNEYQDGGNDAKLYVAQEKTNNYLMAEISRFSNGEARWESQPAPVKPSQLHNFGLDYRSNKTTAAMVEYTLADGSKKYEDIAELKPSSDWTRIEGIFETPANTVSIRLSAVLRQKGWLATDNYELATENPNSRTFNRPLVSVTFDDGWFTSYDQGVAILDKLGLKSTMYINPESIGEKHFMDEFQVRDYIARGHQVGSHSNNHIDLTSVSPGKAGRDLREAREYFKNNFNMTNIDSASPYGKHDLQVDQHISNLYRSHRGTQTGINTLNNFNLYDLKVLFVRKDTKLEQVQQMVDQAKSQNAWFIIVYHQIEDSEASFGVTKETFEKQIQIIQKSGLEVRTVDFALAELLPQLK